MCAELQSPLALGSWKQQTKGRLRFLHKAEEVLFAVNCTVKLGFLRDHELLRLGAELGYVRRKRKESRNPSVSLIL